MALNLTDLFTVIGKYVYGVNSVKTMFPELTTIKNQIFDALEDEGLEDHYTELPDQVSTMETSVASWIQTFIADVEAILVDEEYTLENLPIFETDVTSVLNAIFDQMEAESASITPSVVELATADVDQAVLTITGESDDTFCYVTRLLDGINDPSTLVTAHTSYTNIESQIAISCTVYARCTGEEAGGEILQLFSDSPAESAYTADDQSPGTGPAIANSHSNNEIATNSDFDSWSTDNPTGWTLTGGVAGTAWEDQSSAGDGPLQINTVGVTVKQQLVGLTRRQMYFFGANFRLDLNTGPSVIKLRVENVDGVTVYQNFTNVSTSSTSRENIYGFWAPDDSINLDDVYFCFEYDAETDGSDFCELFHTNVSSVTYYNGLGFNFWNPLALEATSPIQAFIDDYGSLVVENDEAGVFQTFFRKAFNIQLPTSGSPTILDTLADF